MPIEFRCQACQRLLHTPDSAAGGRARCPECGAAVPVPRTTIAADTASVEAGVADKVGAAGPPAFKPSLDAQRPSALDPSAPALRDTPSKHAADTDYPVKGEGRNSSRKQFDTTLTKEVSDSKDVQADSPFNLLEAVDEAGKAAEEAVDSAADRAADIPQINEWERDLKSAFVDLKPVDAAKPAVIPVPLPAPAPLLPASGGSSSSATATPQQDIHIGEIVGTSWKAFVGNLMSGVGVGFVAKLIFAAGVVALVFSMIGLVELIDHAGDEEALVGAFGIVGVFGAFFLLAAWLQSGLYLYVSNISHGHEASFLDLFRGGRFMYRMWFASMIFFVGVAIGLAFFIVPGVIIFTRFCMFGMFIVDRDMGPVQALRESHRVTANRAGKTALTLFVIWAMWNLITTLPLGIFVATPLALWMSAVLFYRLCNDNPQSESPAPAVA